MPPAAVQDALSLIHHALEKGDVPAIDAQLKNVFELSCFCDPLSLFPDEILNRLAPSLGLASSAAIKDDLKDFSSLVKADPNAARNKLNRALQQTSASSNRGPIKFKPIEQLPLATEAPFKWPTLRHWSELVLCPF